MSVERKKIIFVCTGNTCRSPMAEYLLKEELKNRGLQGITVASAGIKGKRGDTINPKSKEALFEQGIVVEKFSSKRLTDKMMKDAFAIVCMTEQQKDYLLDARWQAMRKSGEEDFENNVYAFAEIVGYEIFDPYGKDLDCYRYVCALLQKGVAALADHLVAKNLVKKSKGRGRPKKEKTVPTV